MQKVIHRSITSPYIVRMSSIVWQMKEACCLSSLGEPTISLTRQGQLHFAAHLMSVLCSNGKLWRHSNLLISGSRGRRLMVRGHTWGQGGESWLFQLTLPSCIFRGRS